ncbi:hypothetical protein MKX33_18675 [Paenibacillus sp. FSL R5-0490]|uniref:hypothetical protein n=1 Tax=Paenibacillus sp. FSL R5-0490 TaxID=1920424 RepID=UPI0030D3D9E4
MEAFSEHYIIASVSSSVLSVNESIQPLCTGKHIAAVCPEMDIHVNFDKLYSLLLLFVQECFFYI